MRSVRDVLALMEGWYPRNTADSWDRVGLICGDPSVSADRILLAIDPTLAVADEAVAMNADLVIVHHPLYLRGTSSVAATDPKGRVIHQLMKSDCALYAAHTNADSPVGGVSESLALALGLINIRPLQPDTADAADKLIVFVPKDSAAAVRAAITDAIGPIGAYDSASFSSPGEGRFRPLSGAKPAIGTVGKLEVVEEVRIETVVPIHRRDAVIAAMLAAHPYEAVAYDLVVRVTEEHPSRGTGRLGRLKQPMSLAHFADLVHQALPQTAHGVRVAGDPSMPIETVALCGGAGDFLLDAVRSTPADVYVTSDLRHHPASEFREHGGAGLIDIAHWAAEWTWLPALAARLGEAIAENGATVDIRVSEIVTDPWTFRV